eukprot:SAG11_NODE_3872_length_2177_cov_10.191049_2_plen_80_part_00
MQVRNKILRVSASRYKQAQAGAAAAAAAAASAAAPVTAAAAAAAAAAGVPLHKQRGAPIEQRVADLISKMTLEEKVTPG